MADTIQADYEQLEKIAGRFEIQADICDQLMLRIQQHIGDLENKGWEGKAAEAFFEEMNDVCYPGLNRLINAFTHAAEGIYKTVLTFKDAEQDAVGGVQSSFESGYPADLQAVRPPSEGLAEEIPSDHIHPDQLRNDMERQLNQAKYDSNRWKHIREELGRGKEVREKMLGEVHQVVSWLATMPKNPIDGKEWVENVMGDLKGGKISQAIARSIGGTIGGSFFEILAANQTSVIVSQRAPLYRAFGKGLARALDDKYHPVEPESPAAKAFFDLGQSYVESLSHGERNWLRTDLIENYRINANNIESGNPWAIGSLEPDGPLSPDYFNNKNYGEYYELAVQHLTDKMEYLTRNK